MVGHAQAKTPLRCPETVEHSSLKQPWKSWQLCTCTKQRTGGSESHQATCGWPRGRPTHGLAAHRALTAPQGTAMEAKQPGASLRATAPEPAQVPHHHPTGPAPQTLRPHAAAGGKAWIRAGCCTPSASPMHQPGHHWEGSLEKCFPPTPQFNYR